jgi:hypothetical protein
MAIRGKSRLSQSLRLPRISAVPAMPQIIKVQPAGKTKR